MAKTKKIKKGDWTYTVPAGCEEHGSYPIVVRGKSYTILLATNPTNSLLFDKDNPRNSAEDDIKGGYTAAGQNRLLNYLTGEDGKNGKLKTASKKLEAALNDNGGLAEPLFVQADANGLKVKEGNRRLAEQKKAGRETTLCAHFPDEMDTEAIFHFINTKHTIGAEEWPSFVISKRAHQMMEEFGMELEDIAKTGSFTSVRDVEKYIGAYRWYEHSGLTDISHWSKFHHAYTPALRNHFGYNFDKDTFSEKDRKPCAGPEARKIALQPEEVDAIAGTKTNFKWFVNLIKNDHVTDCRQSDGVVIPAIRNINEPYGPRLMKILQTPPAKPSKGKKKPQAPAELAWSFLRECRRDKDPLQCKTENYLEYLRSILNSASDSKKYRAASDENEVIESLVKILRGSLNEFLKLVQSDQKEAAT